MFIREIKSEDAEEFINLMKMVEDKSCFMLMEKGERKTPPEEQRKLIERLKQQDNSTIFVAEQDEKLIGYLIVIGGKANRAKHSAYIVVGILEQSRGQGVGTALFQRLEEWAKSHCISRLELTVVTENKAGIALYKSRGFEIEGTKRNSLLIDGVFYDEFYMSKLL